MTQYLFFIGIRVIGATKGLSAVNTQRVRLTLVGRGGGLILFRKYVLFSHLLIFIVSSWLLHV